MKLKIFQVGQLTNIQGDGPFESIGIKLKYLKVGKMNNGITDGSRQIIDS